MDKLNDELAAFLDAISPYSGRIEGPVCALEADDFDTVLEFAIHLDELERAGYVSVMDRTPCITRNTKTGTGDISVSLPACYYLTSKGRTYHAAVKAAERRERREKRHGYLFQVFITLLAGALGIAGSLGGVYLGWTLGG